MKYCILLGMLFLGIQGCTTVQQSPDWDQVWSENAKVRASSSSGLSASSSNSMNGSSSSAISGSSSSEDLVSSSSAFQVVKDSVLLQGVYYPTIQVGGQEWLARNVNAGVAVNANLDQTDTILEKYCLNNLDANCTQSTGGLYQWSEALALADSCDSVDCALPNTVAGICPAGWHIPDSTDFSRLLLSLADSGIAEANYGKALRASTFAKGSDVFGFNAFASGFRADSTETTASQPFQLYTTYTGFWVAGQANLNPQMQAKVLVLNASLQTVSFTTANKQDGYSVRCVHEVP